MPKVSRHSTIKGIRLRIQSAKPHYSALLLRRFRFFGTGSRRSDVCRREYRHESDMLIGS